MSPPSDCPHFYENFFCLQIVCALMLAYRSFALHRLFLPFFFSFVQLLLYTIFMALLFVVLCIKKSTASKQDIQFVLQDTKEKPQIFIKIYFFFVVVVSKLVLSWSE